MDIQLWRARIGTFNWSFHTCSSPPRSANSKVSVLLHLSKIFHFFACIVHLCSGLFIHVLLLCLILLDICCIFVLHCFHVPKASAMSHGSFSLSKKVFSFCLIVTLNSSSISIIIRLLILQSGNVEPNPGPPSPKLLSFGVWNVDSLLTRDGVKQSYIESIQSINNFDLFGLCETYLNDKTQDDELDIEGFSKIPKRADCKLATPQSRPRGGVCLYFKESLPVKRRSDMELLDETIVVEISLQRKKIIYILSYRSPSQTPAEFKAYMLKLQTTFIKASSENPSIIILTGDFNARSPLLWADEKNKQLKAKILLIFAPLIALSN